MAAHQDHKYAVQLLLERGAERPEPNMVDQIRTTPLTYALQRGHIDIANILKETGGTE